MQSRPLHQEGLGIPRRNTFVPSSPQKLLAIHVMKGADMSLHDHVRFVGKWLEVS